MKTALLLLMLSGCASMPGIEITADERKACEVQTCTVWSPDELKGMARHFYSEGWKAGRSARGAI